jgi:hypothetical protein
LAGGLRLDLGAERFVARARGVKLASQAVAITASCLRRAAISRV